jgi:hypothetical protein
MNDTLVTIHSLLRWAIVLTGIWAVIRALKGVSGNTAYTGADKKAGLFFMITLDIQLLVGLVLYFVSPLALKAFQASGGAVMKDSTLRYFAVEHALIAIVAIALVHIGRSKVKKAASDAQRHKLSLIFFAIALILLASRIPWPFTAAGAGRGWF